MPTGKATHKKVFLRKLLSSIQAKEGDVEKKSKTEGERERKRQTKCEKVSSRKARKTIIENFFLLACWLGLARFHNFFMTFSTFMAL